MARQSIAVLVLLCIHANAFPQSSIDADRHEFQRRIGPYLNYQQHHPQHQTLEEGILDTTKVVAKRKLLMPIISEGYASTNFQGGGSSRKQEDVKPRSTTTKRPRTTKRPNARRTTQTPKTERTTVRPTSTTPETTSKPVVFQDEPVINGILYNNNDSPLPSKSTSAPIAQRRPDPFQFPTTTPSPYGRPLPLQGHFANPGQGRPASFVQPAFSIPNEQPSLAFDTQNIDPVVDEPEEEIPAFIETDEGKRIELYQGEIITADNNPEGELVQFSFSPPQQLAGEANEKSEKNLLPLASKPNAYEIPSQSERRESRPQPTANPPTNHYHYPQPQGEEIYQAGYEQIEVPQGHTQRRPEGPEKFDPNAFHEDRPSTAVFQGSPQGSNLYPLGKPTPNLPQPPPRPLPPKRRPPPPKKSGGSFFDFLIPSFIRSKPEPIANRRQPNPPPRPPVQWYPPPNPDAPYGSKENPLHLKLPGFPQFSSAPQFAQRPPQARFEDHHQAPPQPNRLDETVIVSRLGEEYYTEVPSVQTLDMSDTEDSNHVIIGTSEPVDLGSDTLRAQSNSQRLQDNRVEGLRKALPTRKQAPFLSREPLQPPMNPSTSDMNVPHQPASLPYQLAEYRHKLQDPEFLQNVTKAHVFHSQSHEEEVEMESVTATGPISYIQDANPFYFRPNGSPMPGLSRTGSEGHEPEDYEAGNDESYDIDLSQFAPQAKAQHYNTRTSKPDVNTVYKPSDLTTSRPPAVLEPTTTDKHPIAEHISSLLQFYLDNPNNKSNLFITETGLNGMEHVEGNLIEGLDELMAPEEESLEASIEEDNHSTFHQPHVKLRRTNMMLPTLPEGFDPASLGPHLEQLFVASSSPQESEWYILDPKGRRVMKEEGEEDSNTPSTETTTKSQELEPELEDQEQDNSTERSVEGGFFPIAS